MMQKPLDRIVGILEGRVRTLGSGAKSLSHLLVVVPTAQSGRRLRLALSRRFGALIPPEVCLPDRLLLDPDDASLASRSEEMLAFIEALGPEKGTVEQAVRMCELRRILAEKALSFADAAERAEYDRERWRELAELETRYLAALAGRGRRDRISAMKAPPPLPPGIEEVLRFDDVSAFDTEPAELPRASIVHCGTAASEAECIAGYFAAVKSDEALPALCVADPEMFPEIVSAFEAKGLKVHDPSSTRLATSSLGHLVMQIASLISTGSYSVFSALIRGGDARRWLCESLGLGEEDMTEVLVDLDNRQAELLPETIDDIAPKTSKKLRAVFEFVKVQLRKKGMRELLASIFRNFILDEHEESAREFAAAAEEVNALLEEVDAAFGEPSDRKMQQLKREVFMKRLDEAVYSLEPDEGDVILTDGWLELPFLDAEELVIAGFQEGCVPESVVGHPYLPDSLRHALGLTDNAKRGERDRRILAMTIASRAPGMVRTYFHGVDAKGDVLKPSRLIFDVADDSDLVSRVKAFYEIKAGTGERPARDLPEEWKLSLPVPPPYEELSRISPTRLDGYLRCPFTYFLRRKDVLGDKRMDDRAEELASWEYGNLAHTALELWGGSDLRDSDDAEAIYAFLEEKVDAQLVDRFGTAIPAIVAMQGESVKRRLRNFAFVQTEWRRAGWRIMAVERKLEVEYGHTRLYGKCDRVDFNASTGRWCVIDYKTWDTADKAKSYDTRKKEWLSLQLPLYCAMLAFEKSGDFAGADLVHISSCYCILGKNSDEVKFSDPMQGEMVPDAEKRAKELISSIERGVFWPPSSVREWKWDYEDWLSPSPEESVSSAWIRDQEQRLGAEPEKSPR